MTSDHPVSDSVVNDKSVFLVLGGPSSVGKTTNLEQLFRERPYERIRSATTRKPRAGEADGSHYHFWDDLVFDDAIAKHLFMEWAFVHGHKRYGTLRSEVQALMSNGKNIATDVNVEGFCNIKNELVGEKFFGFDYRLVSIFFMPPPIDVMIERMRERDAAVCPRDIENRVASIESELKMADRYDHHIDASAPRDLVYARFLEIVDRFTPVPVCYDIGAL